MLILSRVCADFYDHTGAKIFSVTPQTRLTFQEAPEAIREDPLFQMLVSDRSIEVSEDRLRRKRAENDPESEPAAEQDPVPAAGKGSRRKAAGPAA